VESYKHFSLKHQAAHNRFLSSKFVSVANLGFLSW